MEDIETKEAIKIIEYVLGRSKERKGTKMFDKGITLFPDINKERKALNKALDALKALEGYTEVKVIQTEYFTDKPKEAKEVKFGGF